MTESDRILFSNCVRVCVCSPQIAVRLLVHKIHSQEWEALQALTVRDALTLVQHRCFIMSFFTDDIMFT